MLNRKMSSSAKKSQFGGKVVKLKKTDDGRREKKKCAFGCGTEAAPQGYYHHVKGKHKEEYAIGLRITGVKNPGLWTPQTVADIRAVQRADRQEKQDFNDYTETHVLEVTPGCGTRVEDQVEEIVRDLNIAETQHVFYTVLHLKIEAEQERLRTVLDTLRPQF